MIKVFIANSFYLDFIHSEWYPRLWFTKKRSGGAVQWFRTSESFHRVFREFSKDGARARRNPGAENKKLIFPKTWTLTLKNSRSSRITKNQLHFCISRDIARQIRWCFVSSSTLWLNGAFGGAKGACRVACGWRMSHAIRGHILNCYNCNQFSYLISNSWLTGPMLDRIGPKWTGQPWSFSW